MLRKTNIMMVAFALLVLVSCAGQQSIVVDTTGLPPEQVELVTWKVRYAVALDWYEYTLQSFRTNMATLMPEDAKAVYAQAGPLIGGVEASLSAFRAAVYIKSPDPAEQQKAYDAFLRSKAQLLALLARALAD